MDQRGKNLFLHFYAFQSISSRLRHFIFKNFCERKSEQDASAKYDAPDCDTSDSDLLVEKKEAMD